MKSAPFVVLEVGADLLGGPAERSELPFRCQRFLFDSFRSRGDAATTLIAATTATMTRGLPKGNQEGKKERSGRSVLWLTH